VKTHSFWHDALPAVAKEGASMDATNTRTGISHSSGKSPELTRRNVLKLAGAAGGAVALGVSGVAQPAVSAQSDEPKQGGTLTAAMQVDVTSLDPHLNSSYSSTLVIEQVYNGLIQFDPDMNIVPDLAESWTISDDGLVYEFKIRQGVKFHNGREMTVDDVVYSLNRVRDAAGGSPRSYLLVDVESIEATPPDSVRLTLSKPFAALLSHMHTDMAIVPQEVVEENGDLSTTMVGTGPFKFVEFIPNTHAKLVRNEEYHEEGLPYLDELTWIPIPDDPTRTANIQTGTVDFADQIPQQDIDSLQNEPGVQLVRGDSTLHDYLMLNCTRAPFDDVRVRQAIAKTIDRQLMTDVILFGYGTPINGGPIAAWSWAYADLHTYPAPDIEGAKQLLAEAGYPDGFAFTIGAGANYAAQVQAAEMVQEQLRQINVEATVAPQEWGTYIDTVVTQKNFEGAIIGWIGTIDPDDWLYARFHTGEQWNTTGYSNAEVDELLEQGRASTDQAQRKELYNQAEAIIVDEAPFVFFYLYDQFEAVRDYVMGYSHMANNSKLTFKRTWLNK
jgi:peptide/nickel transport system substrate-binding protein